MDRVFSFLLWPKREARGPWKQGRKKRGSITCRTDRANEANKMFIIWLCWLFGFWEGDRELEVRTATYGPGIDQSQHGKSVSHLIKLLTDRKGGLYGKYQTKGLAVVTGWTQGQCVKAKVLYTLLPTTCCIYQTFKSNKCFLMQHSF